MKAVKISRGRDSREDIARSTRFLPGTLLEVVAVSSTFPASSSLCEICKKNRELIQLYKDRTYVRIYNNLYLNRRACL